MNRITMQIGGGLVHEFALRAPFARDNCARVHWVVPTRYPTLGELEGDLWLFDATRPRAWQLIHGIWIELDEAVEPEKSPIDKALDDFIAKRKAKREVTRHPGPTKTSPYDDDFPRPPTESEIALDRACQKLAPHHHTIAERLMPYRVELPTFCRDRGKIAYPTRPQAVSARQHFVSRRRGAKGTTAVDTHALVAYHCEKCGGFHIGRNKDKA